MTPQESYITESYLRREIEVGEMAPVILQTLARLVTPDHIQWEPIDADDWFDKGEIRMRAKNRLYTKGAPHPIELGITITKRFYQPGGTIVRGTPTPTESAGPECTGQYSTIRNHGKNPLIHKIDKTVTLTDSQESTLERGFTLDLTAKESAGYASVSVELEEHLGIEEKDSITKSHTQETSTTFSDEQTVDPAEEVADVYSKTPRSWTQPYTVNALSDIAFNIHLRNVGFFSTAIPPWKIHGYGPAGYLFSKHNKDLWYGTDPEPELKKFPDDVLGNQTWNAKFKSLHHFIGMIKGYDPRAPHMRYLAPRYKKLPDRLTDPATVRLVLSGVGDIDTESDADYTITDIKALTDDQLVTKYAAGQPAPRK